MRKYDWLAKGLLLGFVFFLAALLVKPIGVSTQFSMLSGKMHAAAVEGTISEVPGKSGTYTSTNAYYSKSNGILIKNMQNPVNYDFIFVLSIPLGAYAASRLLGKKEEESQQDTVAPAKSIAPWKQFTGGFVGGVLLLYGSRMADGCTSGHMMAGMSQGSFSGFVFAAAVFAVAIPTAILAKKYLAGGK